MKKFILLVLLLITSASMGQSVITGIVIDGDFNEPLAFANVVLREQGSTETVSGAITDFEGKYVFEVNGPGPYEIEFSYLGYETKVVSEIKTKEDVVGIII